MALSYGVGAVCTAKHRKNSKPELYNQFLFCNRFLLSCTIFALSYGLGALILNLEVIEQHLEMVLRCQACVGQIAGDMVPFM